MRDVIDVERLLTQIVTFIPDLVMAIIMLVLFQFAIRLTREPLRKVFLRTHMERGLVDLLVDRVYTTLVMIFGAIMAASQIGIDVVAALAGLSVAGIAIGFAAQDTLSNIIAGFVIFWDQPFRVGDMIDVAGHYGRVKEITLRSTRIRTNNNTFVVIPNRMIIDEVLVNSSKHGYVRLQVPVGIAYKEDITAARDVLVAAVGEVDGVLRQPAPEIVATGLGDSSIDLLIHAWILDAADEKPIFYRVVEAAKNSLDAAGIEIPFPHRQLIANPESFELEMLQRTEPRTETR